MGLRFLVVEGNTREARQGHRATYGLTPSGSYAAVIEGIAPGVACEVAYPADPGANLPDAGGLEGYDGWCSRAPTCTSTTAATPSPARWS
jgi:GMP synthase (glutamine-hydrolysing)